MKVRWDLDSPSQPNEAPAKRRPGRPRLEAPSQEYIARRDEIIATAAEVFHQKGYDAGTLEDVAEALDLRRASIYYYVRSKAHLLFLIIDRALGLALDELDEYTKLPDPRERLETFIRHQVRTITGEPSMFTVFFDHRLRLEQEYEARIRDKERRYVRAYLKVVQDAVKAGVIGKVDPRYGAQAILGMTTWSYKWFDPTRDNADRLADSCVKLVLDNLGAPA